MKIRESGMPDEDIWTSFFDPDWVLERLGLDTTVVNAVEFGCGYGIFTCQAVRLVAGEVHAFDIEPEMIAATKAKVKAAGLSNVRYHLSDFVAKGTGLPDESVDYVMLFNILHAARPLRLLEESCRILTPKGRVAITHWNYDPTTPRGPSMSIRPKPKQCITWAEQAGLKLLPPGVIALPPYHYGIALEK